MYQQSKNEEKKQKSRFKRNESKSDSELRKLKKENARLQEELSMTQQTPREEVTCKGEITDSRKKVVQLRLMFNSQVSERMLKEKQLINLSNKVQTINMELGEDPNLTPTSNRVDTPSSSMNDTQEEVQNRKVETEIKLQNLEKEKVQLEQQLQEIAVNGTDFSFRRHEMDEIEDKTHQSASRLKYLMSHLDRAGKQIAGAQIGIEAILNKLDYLKVRAPADQQKVEAKPDKIGAPMGIQSMTGADTHKGEHRGQDGLSIEEHEDPLLRQLEIVDQKLGNIVDALAASTMGKTAGDMHTEGEAEGPATTMSWLKTDFQKLGLAEPQQGQYNLRVNLTTPTAAMASHPSSAGAFDADGLSDDSLEQDTRPRKKYSIMPKQG